MYRKRLNPSLCALLVLVLAVLACGAPAIEPTATPLPRNTDRPRATATPVEEEPEPTQPRATQTPEIEAPFALSAEPYAHPSGAFSLTLPEGWEIEAQDNSVFVSSPDDVASIEVSATNVGVAFDDETLRTFIQAVEDNWFATFANYTAGDLEPQSDGSLGIFRTLDLSDGTPQSVFSYYWQEGTVVYEQDFWVNSDEYEDYVAGLVEVANTMEMDPEAGAKADVYAIVYAFTGPNDLFEFYVPYGWLYQRNEGENTIADRFAAPDDGSFIENVTYDDGQEWTSESAEQYAQDLLRERYQLEDLEITDSQVQEDGSVRLNWLSSSQGLEGESFYETRNSTTFLLLTWVVPSDAYELYQPVWSNLVGSYGLPEPEAAAEEGN